MQEAEVLINEMQRKGLIGLNSSISKEIEYLKLTIDHLILWLIRVCLLKLRTNLCQNIILDQ